MSKTPESNEQRAARPWFWPVSCLLAFHVTAVFIAPFTFASRSGPGVPSPSADLTYRWCRPYIDAAFLNHGYFFFAPNPGPSHLVEYKLTFADDRPAVTRMFPDRNRHWPRLRYHRYFMLSEWLNTQFVPPEPPPEVVDDPVAMREWRTRRDLYQRQKQAYADHLKSRYGADEVIVRRIEHRLPAPFEFVESRRQLSDHRTYVELPDTPMPGAGAMPGAGRLPEAAPLPGAGRIPGAEPLPGADR